MRIVIECEEFEPTILESGIEFVGISKVKVVRRSIEYATKDRIVAVASEELIVSKPADQEIVKIISMDLVVAVAAVDDVERSIRTTR